AAGLRAVCPVRTIPKKAASVISTIPRYDIFLFIAADLLRRLGQGQGILNRRLGSLSTALIKGREKSYAGLKPMSIGGLPRGMLRGCKVTDCKSPRERRTQTIWNWAWGARWCSARGSNSRLPSLH